MTETILCPACGFTLAANSTTSVHRSSEGLVRYLRCLCGLRIVSLAGKVIGSAGSSDFSAFPRRLVADAVIQPGAR